MVAFAVEVLQRSVGFCVRSIGRILKIEGDFKEVNDFFVCFDSYA